MSDESNSLIPGQMVFGASGFLGVGMVCKGCGGVFTAKRSDAIYCSSRCRQDAYRRRHGVPLHRGRTRRSGQRQP
jgi:hypothetical protein